MCWGWREGSPTCICTRGVLMAGEGPLQWATADPESQAWPFVSPVESFFLSTLWLTDSYSLCQSPRDVALVAGWRDWGELLRIILVVFLEPLWAGDEGCVLTGSSPLLFGGDGSGGTGVKEGMPFTGLTCPPWVFCVLSGLLPPFLLSEPWTMGFSKSFKRKFFYNKKTKNSTFDLPSDAIAPFQ